LKNKRFIFNDVRKTSFSIYENKGVVVIYQKTSHLHPNRPLREGWWAGTAPAFCGYEKIVRLMRELIGKVWAFFQIIFLIQPGAIRFFEKKKRAQAGLNAIRGMFGDESYRPLRGRSPG
jgi:hypothetical protein